MRHIDLNRQLMGVEDFLFGVGKVLQTRGGQQVEVTKINASNLPFDETQSLLEWAQSVNLVELGQIVEQLAAIGNNLQTIINVDNNETNINIVAGLDTELTAIYTNLVTILNVNSNKTNINKVANNETNINKVANNETNINKVSNNETNITKVSSNETNINKVAAINANITTLANNIVVLNSLYTNLAAIQTNANNITAIVNIHNNMTGLNSIVSQVIPNMAEILLVDNLAIQVANDRADVASMKLAVETIYDTFDDRFLGSKLNDPTVDNDGNALIDGAMYFNTSSNALKVYDLGTTTWITIPKIYLSGLLDVVLTSITTGDILYWNGSKWANTRTPKFDSIQLKGGTGTNGTATWNNTEYTYDIVLNPNVTLQVGQEDLVYCKNNSASVIANGRPVMASGTNGNSGNILVDLHNGTKANARRIVGITTEDLTANGYGFVTRNGKVRGINTTGSQYGETWIDGDILYVKATGALTKVEPVDTALKMPIAFVIHAHTNGTLYVRTTGIDENHDRDFINNLVDIHSKTAKTTLADADEFMTADSTSSFSLKKITWASIKTLLTSLFIPKVTSTDNAVVRFDGGTGEVQNSSILIDDSGNLNITGTGKRITGDFSNLIDVNRLSFESSTTNTFTVVSALPNGTGPLSSFRAFNTAQGLNSSFTEIFCDQTHSMVRAGRSGTGPYLPMTFYTNGSERMRIDTAGNVGIGTNSPTNNLHISSATESVVKLQNTGAGGCWLRFDPVTAGYIWGYTNTPIIFGTNNSERARFTPAGDFLLTSGSGALGYGTGAGGIVTQGSSLGKSTSVVLDKPSGSVIMNNAALASQATVYFGIYNNKILSTDGVVITQNDGGLYAGVNYDIKVAYKADGLIGLIVKNLSPSTLSDAVRFRFDLIRGANS